MKFSIIIPIYNVNRSFFVQCMLTILAEEEDLYEIILVDDGSEIECSTMCDQYARDHRAVKVFHKENGGVSSARNYGIEKATGEWVLFIDADDWIEENALSRIKTITEQTDAELVFFGYYKNFPSKELKITSATYASGTVISSEEEKIGLQKKIIGASEYGETGARATTFRSVWSVAFRRELLIRDSIRFAEGIPIGEDLIFRLYTSQYARKILYSDYCYYHYRNNQDSASCMYRESAVEDSLRELSEIAKFMERHQASELQEAYQFRVVEIMTVLPSRCFFHKDNNNSYWERRKMASRFMQSNIVKQNVTAPLVKKLPLKRKVQAFLLKNSIFELYMLIIRGNKKARGLD